MRAIALNDIFADNATLISSRSASVRCFVFLVRGLGLIPPDSRKAVKTVPGAASNTRPISLNPVPCFHKLKTRCGVLCRRVKERYPFIKARTDKYPVRRLCSAMQVNPSGYYDWLREPQSRREQEDKRLTTFIKQFWLESGCHSGYRNIYLDLMEANIPCGRDRVLRLMRQADIEATRWIVSLKWSIRISGGLVILLMLRPMKASCLSLSLWTYTLATSLAGRWVHAWLTILCWVR